jgi:hypothetical protein
MSFSRAFVGVEEAYPVGILRVNTYEVKYFRWAKKSPPKRAGVYLMG